MPILRLCLRFVVVVVLVAAATRADALPINAIAQASFEANDGSWVTSNASARTCATFSGHTGPCWGLLGGSGSLVQTLLSPVLGSQVTQLSLYATMWSGGAVPPCCATVGTLQVTVGYTSGPSSSAQQIVQIVDQWTPFDFTFVVDPSRTVSSIRLDHFTSVPGGGYLGIDDVALVFDALPEPAILALIAPGLVALVASRRASRPRRRR